MNNLKELICKCGAAQAGVISYSDCDIINQRLIDKLSFPPKSVFIGIIPYYTHHCDKPRTISAYALPYDYHNYIKCVCENIVSQAQEAYPQANFAWFGDHSPINEKLATAKAGLGIIGEHSLLITPEYSSFVFLFEILTDIEFNVESHEIQSCEKCGRCISSCTVDIFNKSSCLSAITQKKGDLDDKEKLLIRNSGCVWGCDICQIVCPHTTQAINSGSIYSEIDWFNNNIITTPTPESVNNIEDFSKRAYSWRGTSTILRNINIVNSTTEE